MTKRSTLCLLILISLLSPSHQAMAAELDNVPSQVTFLISGGLWEDPGESSIKSNSQKSAVIPPVSSSSTIRRGYYRVVAVRQPDQTSKVYLQQIQVSDAGAQLIDRVELQEISDLHAYVTDIRTDDTAGINRTLGLSATVYLKSNPKSVDPESWSVIVDEFGEIQVARESH